MQIPLLVRNNSIQLRCQAFTMIGYIFALLPLYMLVYVPVSQMLWGPSNKHSSSQQIVEFNSSIIADDQPLSCPLHNYNTFILSHEPLIIYIEDFLSPSESTHLLEIRLVKNLALPGLPSLALVLCSFLLPSIT